MMTSLFCLSYCFKVKSTEPGEDPYSPSAPPLSPQLHAPRHSVRRPKRRAPPPPSPPIETVGPAPPLTNNPRYIRSNTPSVITCIAVLTLLIVQVSNGQDIAIRDGDIGKEEQATKQLLSDIQPDNTREYHKGDTLELTCTYLEKYNGQRPVTWRTLPDEEEIKEKHEIGGGKLLFKQLNANLTGVFCLVKRGKLS